MRHENVGAVHTHTHTHTHTCISLKEEKRVDAICSKSDALKIIVAIILVSVQILDNLIFKVERLLFSKLSYYSLVC